MSISPFNFDPTACWKSVAFALILSLSYVGPAGNTVPRLGRSGWATLCLSLIHPLAEPLPSLHTL